MVAFLAVVFLVCGTNALIDVTKDLQLSAELKTVVEPLSVQAKELFSSDAPISLGYSIFDGQSDLRKVASQQHPTTSKTLLSLEFLLQKQLDAAHEVVLGVEETNVPDAEYAATHSGQTTWMKDHPFSDEDDLVHSIIHRLEGDLKGEGGHVGWENAKFWVAGGPKKQKRLGHHAVHEALCSLCPTIAPSLTDLLIARKMRQHEIIAGGGKLRTLCVDKGCFDPISFIQLCQHVQWNEELRKLQVAEVLLLIRLELCTLCGEIYDAFHDL
jgi:hypothetical protein